METHQRLFTERQRSITGKENITTIKPTTIVRKTSLRSYIAKEQTDILGEQVITKTRSADGKEREV